MRDALQRLNYACSVVVHTECNYIAAAVNNRWPEAWRMNGWKNGKGKEVKDADLWEMIFEEMEEGGHELLAIPGKHEFSHWMAWNLPLVRAWQDVFCTDEKL